MATLAGRLLWYEGVTPDMRRSPDLVAISVDTENYLVLLKNACDIMATAFIHFGVEPRKRKQTPKEGSFHDLLKWVKKDTNNVYEPFRFITEQSDWFTELKDFRDDLIHRGYNINIFTDRVLLVLIFMKAGDAELQLLRGGYKVEDYREDRPRFPQYPLLSLLKRFTVSVLDLAENLAQAIAKQQQFQLSRTHLLNGVYVPALHHITSYQEPTKRHLLKPAQAEQLRIVAWYLVKAGDYLNSLEYGYPDGHWWRFLMRLSELFTVPPISVSQPEHTDCGFLTRWRFLFGEGEEVYAVSVRDSILLREDWLKNSKANLDAFAENAHARRAVLVVSGANNPDEPTQAGRSFSGLIIESDPITAAEKAFTALTDSSSDTDGLIQITL